METVINIHDTSNADGVIDIAKSLPPKDELANKDAHVVLKFLDRFFHLPGLVLLCTWRKSLPATVKVSIDDSMAQMTVRRLLKNTGFRDIIESGVETPSYIARGAGRVPILPVLKGFSTEQTIADITRMFDDLGQVESPEPFRVLLSELCENTFAHSEFDTPGYICARIQEQAHKCDIAIADSGIGIASSYQEGTNEEAKGRITGGASAIEIALDGLSSSKPTPVRGSSRSYYGWGLFIARRLIELNRGRMVVISGKEAVVIERFKKDRIRLPREWSGTFVSLLIDTGNAIPLEDVYQEATRLLVPDGAPTVRVNSAGPVAAAEGRPSKPTMLTPAPPPAVTTPPSISHTLPEEHVLALADYGKQLLTRELGLAIRADVATHLATGSRIKVILDSIDDITPSVVDECFGKLAAALGRERFERSIVFAGGHAAIHRLVDLVISGRLRGTKA